MSGITDPTEEYFKDGCWGWDGTQWRKLGLIFGYYDRLAGQVVNLNASAGENILTGDAVPAGEIWILQAICALDSTSNVSRIYIRANTGTVACVITDVYSIAAGHWFAAATNMVMKTGDYLNCTFAGCTAGDYLYFRWWGYKMKVS